MGSVCCCLRAEDFEDYMNPESSVYRNCTCLSCFIQNFLNVVCFIFLIIVHFPHFFIIFSNDILPFTGSHCDNRTKCFVQYFLYCYFISLLTKSVI